MARLLATAGYREICCTPHRLRGRWDIPPDSVRSATSALQMELERSGVPIVLHPGMEYYLDEFLPETLADPLLLPGRLLLVELPTRCYAEGAKLILTRLVEMGMTPLIAHPERCELFTPPAVKKRGLLNVLRTAMKIDGNAPPVLSVEGEFVDCLLGLGCKFQGNLGSLLGHYGSRVKKNALHLQASGLYTHWGSDAHCPEQLQAVLNHWLSE